LPCRLRLQVLTEDEPNLMTADDRLYADELTIFMQKIIDQKGSLIGYGYFVLEIGQMLQCVEQGKRDIAFTQQLLTLTKSLVDAGIRL
jgi:hypothetical protein